MRAAIPARVVIRPTEPEIGAQIDDAICKRRELIDAACRTSMWQAQKQEIHALQRLGPHELQCRSPAQVGVCEVNELTVETFAGHLPDIEPRMVEQQSKQFAAGVARRANDGGAETIGHAALYRRAFGKRDRGHVRLGAPQASRWLCSSPRALLADRSPPCAPEC